MVSPSSAKSDSLEVVPGKLLAKVAAFQPEAQAGKLATLPIERARALIAVRLFMFNIGLTPFLKPEFRASSVIYYPGLWEKSHFCALLKKS